MSTRFNIFLLLTFLFLAHPQHSCLSYDSEVVHPNVNEAAVYKSELDSFMKRQLGFRGGIRTKIDGEEALKWFREGGKLEDNSPRWLNHFHDPLKPWDNAGFDLPGLLPDVSSLVWAQLSDDPMDYTVNRFCWTAARNHYYKALTTGSESDWALAFRTLGRLMHLVADAAVPAHVRNDSHPFGEPYEAWAAAKGSMDQDLTSELDYKNAYPVAPTIFNRAVHNPTADSMAPSSISALWDQDVYVPGGSPQDGLVGLAEYTNAYFFSEDTLNTNEYPHPNPSDTDILSIDWKNPELVDKQDGKKDLKIYLHHGSTNRRLATISYFLHDCLPPRSCWDYSLYFLDDAVYRDSASLLIPRAVGYCTALLDYFFRDTIEITAGSEGIYSLYNPNDLAGDSGGFRTITLMARNSSAYAGEVMSDGKIELIVKYRVARSDPFVSAYVPASEPLPNIIAPEKYGVRSIPSNGFVELAFDLPGALPKEATDLYLQLVYKGTIGVEKDGVAMGFKDISEPTPYDIFNNMDWVCMSGAWLPAGSPGAMSLADANENGAVDADEWDVFPHRLNNLDVRYSPSSAPLSPPPAHFSIAGLEPGQSYRVFVLGDAYFGSGVSLSSNSPIASFGCIDQSWHSGFPGSTRAYPSVKRQTEWYSTPEECASYGLSPPCEVPRWPRFLTWRGKDGYWALRVHYLRFPYDSVCSLDTLSSTPPDPGQSPCAVQ